MENNNNNNKLLNSVVIIILVAIVFFIAGYFTCNIITKNNALKNDEQENNQQGNNESKQNSIAWFESYITPLMKVGSEIDASKIEDDGIFVLCVNINDYVLGTQNISYSRVGEYFLVKQTDVAKYAKKYFGKDNFVYNVDDGSFKYSASDKGYLSKLDFGIGVSEGPVETFTVNSVKYSGNNVTLEITSTNDDNTDKNYYEVKLTCVGETCTVNSVETK